MAHAMIMDNAFFIKFSSLSFPSEFFRVSHHTRTVYHRMPGSVQREIFGAGTPPWSQTIFMDFVSCRKCTGTVICRFLDGKIPMIRLPPPVLAKATTDFMYRSLLFGSSDLYSMFLDSPFNNSSRTIQVPPFCTYIPGAINKGREYL